MDLLSGASDTVLMAQVLAYYRETAPLIVAGLDGSPLIYRNYPGGLDKDGVLHSTELPLTVNRLLWSIHAKYAIEFFTWAPLPADEDRLRFARILIEPPPGVGFERVKHAAQVLRTILRDLAGLGAVPLVDGGHGAALWVPFADAPHAVPLRAWLHRIANHAAELHPNLISTEPNTHHDGRVHVHVSSNAPRHCSAVPYSLRPSALAVCTPIRWDELAALERADAFRADAMPARIRELGDLFAKQVDAIGKQDFGSAGPGKLQILGRTTPGPRGHIITAAIEILEDGKARTAQEILDEALARKLVPEGTTKKYIYVALFEYIGRQLGRGRKPPIVQDNRRLVRINEPPDES